METPVLEFSLALLTSKTILRVVSLAASPVKTKPLEFLSRVLLAALIIKLEADPAAILVPSFVLAANVLSAIKTMALFGTFVRLMPLSPLFRNLLPDNTIV